MVMEFNGEEYKKSSRHQKEWGGRIIAELALAKEARVLDLGCGDGVLTAQLAELVPEGRVLGIDCSQGMLATANQLEKGNLSFQLMDINDLAFENDFDLIFSNATLHWVKDHRSLLRRIYDALKPSGRIRFNFAAEGNCSHFNRIVREVMTKPCFACYFTDFQWPWFMPKVEEYERLVRTQAFTDVKVWGEEADRYFANTEEMTGWIDQPSLVPFVHRLPRDEASAFRDEVIERMIALTRQPDGRCFETFRRINVSARKPGE